MLFFFAHPRPYDNRTSIQEAVDINQRIKEKRREEKKTSGTLA